MIAATQQAARNLFLRAAKAGHGRAQAVVFAGAKTPAELADMTAEVGVPKDGYARLFHAIRSLEIMGPLQRIDPKRRADFVALATSERQLGLLTTLVQHGEDVIALADEVRAIANSGYIEISGWVVQVEIIRRTSFEQLVERARGELGLAAAFCGEAPIIGGQPILPARHAVRLRAGGSAGISRGRCWHFYGTTTTVRTGAPRTISPVSAMPCSRSTVRWTLPCIIGIGAMKARTCRPSGSYGTLPPPRRLGAMGVAGLGILRPHGLRSKTGRLQRNLYTLIVRTSLIDEACLTQRVDVANGAVEANPQCPWRKPIVIPAEFLGGTK